MPLLTNVYIATDDLRMDGLAQRKQRSNSLKHSQDPRKVVMAKHGQQGSKDGLLRTKDNVCEPGRGSLAFVVLPPLKNKPKAPSITTTTSFSGLPAMGNVRRRTTTSLDYPLHSPRKPSRDRQHLCSPTRRNNPQPDGLVYQSPYNRHSKVRHVGSAVVKARTSLRSFLVQ